MVHVWQYEMDVKLISSLNITDSGDREEEELEG
jgi:hypothetical protein